MKRLSLAVVAVIALAFTASAQAGHVVARSFHAPRFFAAPSYGFGGSYYAPSLTFSAPIYTAPVYTPPVVIQQAPVLLQQSYDPCVGAGAAYGVGYGVGSYGVGASFTPRFFFRR
jgi:hypothetical protein